MNTKFCKEVLNRGLRPEKHFQSCFSSHRKSFTSVYSKEDRINWHQQWDRNTLLVGHDSYVDFMDLRDGKGFRNFINITNGSKIAVRFSH